MLDQTSPFSGSAGREGSPRMPITARTVETGPAVATEQDDGRSAVAGDVSAAGVDDVSEVVIGNHCSMSFLPISRFMNELAVIIPMNPGTFGVESEYARSCRSAR